jgi:hypothetical protein
VDSLGPPWFHSSIEPGPSYSSSKLLKTGTKNKQISARNPKPCTNSLQEAKEEKTIQIKHPIILASGVVESFSDTLEWIESVVYNP